MEFSPELIKARDKVVSVAEEHIAFTDKTMDAVLHMFRFSGGKTEHHVQPIQSFMNSTVGKDALAVLIKTALEDPDSPVEALIMVSECWMATAGKYETLDTAIPPSKRADRSEIVMINTMTANKQELRLYDINRITRTIKLKNDAPMDKFEGRFARNPPAPQ